MNFDAVAKWVQILGGAGFLVFLGNWLAHFFASGGERLADRRRDKDQQQKRIDDLEAHVRILNLNLLGADYVRNVQTAQINRLTWFYDQMRLVLTSMTTFVERSDPEQTYIVMQARSYPKAEDVLNEAERIFTESNPPPDTRTEANKV